MVLNNYKIIVLYDTREKSNSHILSEFDKHNIEYRRVTFKYGDYSFLLKNLTTGEEIDFRQIYVIERKSNLEELSQNLGKLRQQFINEIKRSIESGAKMDIVIENPKWYYDILTKNYNTQFKPQQFKNSICAIEAQYDINFLGVDKRVFSSYIYSKFVYKAKTYLYKQMCYN